MSRNMKATRQALVDLLKPLLVEVDSDYRVEQRFRQATFDSRDRRDRIAVMGDKSTYCEVLYNGRGSKVAQYTNEGKPIQVSYNFGVTIWLGYFDAPDYANSSQALFDTICEEKILPTLEQTANLGGAEYNLIFNPESVHISMAPLDSQGEELAHTLSFIIEVWNDNY